MVRPMVVLITGCRSGFGKRAAITVARAGHTVYASLRDVDTAGPLMAEAQGLDVRPLQLDVTVPAQREAAVARILAEQERLDALVNNAGVSLAGFLEQLEPDEIRHLFEVNVFGAWALTREVLPTLRAQRSGTVVMVSSMAGRLAMPGLGAYASSKWALEGMSEAWRHELAPWGVRVVLVEPGPYATDILDRNRRLGRRVRDPDSPWAPMVERLMGLFEEQAPRRSGDPQEVADAILRVLERDAPRLRHPMGPLARTREVLKRLAPFWVIERIVRRVVGLPAPPRS